MADLPETLDERARARGRRLALTSHPLGMTHHRVFTSDLPTLALVSLGAGDALVGLQRSFELLLQVLRLPTLRMTARWRMRWILVAGQVLAVVFGAPLVLFDAIASRGGAAGLPIVMASLALTAGALAIAQTVWFPLLYTYVDADRTGRFFGLLRSGWHATLVLYFLGAQRWLAAHPGAFSALFTVGWLCGAARIAFLARLPEERGRDGVSAAPLRLLLTNVALRRYLAGVTLSAAARRTAIPFAIVWLRRHLGLTDADVVLTTIATFAGQLVSLYGWGRLADRLGAWPVFVLTGVGGALATVGLLALPQVGAATVAIAVALFFAMAFFLAGFEIADTQLLFSIAPSSGATPTLVVAAVVSSVLTGLAPVAAGIALELALGRGAPPTLAYGSLFAITALAQILSLPILRPRRD